MATCGVLPSSPASDELLAHGVRGGDDRAFELLYRRYWDPLCRYAARLLRDVPAGEDAAQVALANAYRALRAGQTPRSVRPWLYGIARNAAWGLRTERGDAVELPPALEARTEPPAGDTAALMAALARLPERQRLVFSLRELRGVTSRETADLLGLRESQVEQLLFAGRARLAELLVFGESVSCETVRATGTAQLNRQERRAFKRHAHHCAECRTLLGGRVGLGARLIAPLEALRRLVELGIGAAGPAKTSVAAAIALAVSTPVVLPAVHSIDQPAPRQTRIAILPTADRVEPTSTLARAQAQSAPVKRVPQPRPVLSAAAAPTPPSPVSLEQPAPIAPRVAVTRTRQPEIRPTGARPAAVAPVTRERTTTTRTAVAPSAPPPARELETAPLPPTESERSPSTEPTDPRSSDSSSPTTLERVAPEPSERGVGDLAPTGVQRQ
jgi:RNA polymerase sigma factor (sigma-70 family)